MINISELSIYNLDVTDSGLYVVILFYLLISVIQNDFIDMRCETSKKWFYKKPGKSQFQQERSPRKSKCK